MNPTHLIILNRSAASADGWIHIVPKGELPNRAAGLVQVLDDAALDSILANITADRTRLGDKWPGVYAGREHFIYNDEHDSAALAWFKDFEKRADGIWASDKGLTPVGKQVIANGEYKFTSFVADRKDCQKIEGNKVRILKLDTVGFTNQANGKELLTPITNRNNLPGSRESAASPNNNNERTKTMKSIAAKLGLAAEASEDAILGEVTKLQNRLTTLEPLSTENTTLKNRNTELETEQCDTLLDAYQVKDAKARETLKPMLSTLKNRADRVTALTNLGHKLPDAKKPAGTKVLNRGQAEQTPQGDKVEAVSVTPQQLDAEVRKLMNRDGIKDFTVGFNALMGERPELFAKAE